MNWSILILFEVFLTKSLFFIMLVDSHQSVASNGVATIATNNNLMNHSMLETEPQRRSMFQNNHEQKLTGNNGSNNPQHLHQPQQVNRNATTTTTTTTTTTIMARRMLRYNTFLNTFIFSLTLIPLLFTLARTLNTWPHYHGFYYARRLKRSSPPLSSSYVMNALHGSYNRLPLMSKDDTKRFLSLFEQTLSNRRILDEQCRKYYSCKVFQNAVKITDSNVPKLADFEWSLLETFGIVVERYDHQMDLVKLVKMYYEIATNALKGVSCKHQYPCNIPKKNGHKTGTWSQHRS